MTGRTVYSDWISVLWSDYLQNASVTQDTVSPLKVRRDDLPPSLFTSSTSTSGVTVNHLPLSS